MGEQEGWCEPSLLHSGSHFQRGFCSGIEIQMLGATDFPGPSATLLRRCIASFHCGTVFGILLSDKKGRVPNGVILELPTAGRRVLSKGLPTAARLRCPQGPTALARSWETQSHILSVSEGCTSHFDVTGQEDHSAQVLHAHRREEGAQTWVASRCWWHGGTG